MRVRPIKPISQAYFHQQPTRKEVDVRAKVEETKDAVDRFEAAKPVCNRITRAVIIGTLIYLAAHILIWVWRGEGS